ncbi:MAG TPA: hypothetical protein VMH33_01255 [Solirubrobacterales bacterium]|nr:hypothetical protein [Solirubrobacterales bacterium]
MKKRLCLILAIVAAFTAFVGVSSASAATEFGSGCAAEEGEEFLDLISTGHGPGSPLPVTAPISGVVTEWRLNLGLSTGPVPPELEEFIGALYGQKLQIFSDAGGGNYTLTAESAPTSRLNLSGTTTSTTRLPIKAGQYLGLRGNFFTFYCETSSAADKLGYIEGPPFPSVGSTAHFETTEGFQVPVVARIEPDVDGDGYGDETQDQCPQSAAYQTPCPVVTISSLPTVAKNAVTLYVSTSLSAPVGVTASVKLPKGKPVTLTAAAQTVAPGSLTPFKITLNSKVKKALKELPKSKSLKMSITASATNVTGAPSTSVKTVKLKGQAKPKKK